MSQLTPAQALELALDHHRAGRIAQAEDLYRQLHAVLPGNADIVQLLGLVAYHAGRHPEARELIDRAIAMNPNVAHYHHNLGTLFLDLGELDAALAAYGTALRLDPRNAGTWHNCGLAFMRQQQWPAAIEAYRKALEYDPDFPSCRLDLGTALACSGRLEEAITLYREGLQRRPRDGALFTNLGNLLKKKGDTDAAIEAYRGALALDGNDAITLNNLAGALRDQGASGASVATFRRALEITPDQAVFRSNLILALYYDPQTEPATLAAEHREWNRHHLQPFQSGRLAPAHDRSPERPLRIGYVSHDFRDHPVGRALLPVFERHDPAQFALFGYANRERDEVTERFLARATAWRIMDQLSDDQLAAQIREDGIDLLVDLGLHTSDNRLGVFARKPAPVQVSWLGYPGSSGLETIDYRLTDACLEPPGSEPQASREEPWRLPDCWTCYEPPAGYPPVNALPALHHGHVTFGSFNSFVKINDGVLEVWARILQAVPGSRLVLLTKFGGHRQRVGEFLRARGIEPGRLDFADYQASASGQPTATYLHRYAAIDIALDTSPYNGMTTTCDALWMGVPVVSLVGKFSLGRAGLSLLSTVGLPELAVPSEEEYVRCAVALAHDLPRLTALRATLRSRLQSSPLLDAARLTRHVEAAYRSMWRRWCVR